MRNVLLLLGVLLIVAIGYGSFALLRAVPNVWILFGLLFLDLIFTIGIFTGAIRGIKKSFTIPLIGLLIVVLGLHGFIKGFELQRNTRAEEQKCYDENPFEYELLFMQTIDVEQKHELGQTWLHIYSTGRDGLTEDQELQIVGILLNKGADINNRDNCGETPLFWAVRFGKEHIVELLIDHDAKINAKEQEGATPLDQALRLGNRSMVELLHQHGAKTSAELDQQE